MIDIPAALIERIKARQAVLVTGLGCSRLASLPGWDDLGERMLAWLDEDKGSAGVRAKIRALLSSGRRAAAIAYLRSKLGAEALADLMADAYPPGVAVPPPFARVAEIPWRGVITTAFDDLWDRAIQKDPTNVTRGFLPHEADALEHHRGRFLLHVFGVAATPESLCLSPGDLRQRITPTGVIEQLDDVYQKRSFVFLGFEPGDPDLRMVSERLLGANVNHVEHFILYPGQSGSDAGFDADLLGAELAMTAVPFTGTLADVMIALGDMWNAVAADARPPESDLEAWMELWTRDPSDDEPQAVLRRAEERLRAEKDWEKLVDLLLGRVERIADRAEQVAVLREVGRIFEEELALPDRAFAALSMAFGLDPENAAVLPDLLRVVGKAGRWGDFVVEYAEIASRVGDPETRARHGLEIARIYAEELAQPERAITEYRQVMEAEAASGPSGAPGPSHGPASRALIDLLDKQKRWAELGPLLTAAAERETSRPRQVELYLRIADLQEKAGDFDAAIAALETVVAGEGVNRPALRALERLYDRQGRGDEYLKTVERLRETAEEPSERLTLLRRLAAEWEERPDGVDRAVEALEQILLADARDDDAFRALCRIYRQARRWQPLGEALRRKIEVTDDPAGRRELHATLGALHDEETGEPDRALEAYASAEALGDHREATLEALARLYEQRGLWRPAADALDHWTKAAKDPAVRTAAAFRAAAILADKLGDRRAAEERYARVLEIDPTHVEAMEALAALYRQQGDYLRAAKLLLEVAERSGNRIQKVRLFYDVGIMQEESLGDPARAADLYAATLAVDPEHVDAARRLVPIYTSAERWADLEPVLDMLARKDDGQDPGQAAELYARLAFTAQKAGNGDKALRSFEAARQLCPGSMAVLAGFAELRMERQEWGEAARLYEALLAEHEAALPPAEIHDVYLKIARCQAGQGSRGAALGFYQKASAHGALGREALGEVAALHAAAGDFEALVQDQRALLRDASDDDTRARLSEEMGDVYLEKLKNPSLAIAAYQGALGAQPNRRSTLQKLLELYTAGKQWSSAADALVRIAELEAEPAVRAKYVHSAALIRRDELGDADGAVELLNWALDEDPEMMRAFEAIERLLTDAESWKELARNYRKMIKRVPGDGAETLRLRLWDNLGEVALLKLDDVEMATTAYEVASTLDPDNLKRHEALAELYVQAGPDKIDKAIAEHQMLLAKNPDRLASYRALARLYRDAGASDKLWCVAATLTFLRKADADLAELYDRHKPREPRPAKQPFNDEIWEKVVHPQEDPFIAAVFMLLGHFVAATVAQQHQAVGLRRRDRVDVAADPRLPMRVLRNVSETLELPAPDVFYRDGDTRGLSMLNLQEKGVLTPAFLMGQGIAQRTSEPEVVFEIGKGMAFLRPERFLRYAVASPGALDIALRSALALGGAGIGHGGHNGEVDKLTAELRRLVPRPVAEQMAIVGRKLVSAHGEVINVQDWMAAADLTAARVGFVLSNDLTAAARIITAEPAAQSPLPAKQRMKDLLGYSVSEEYFAVRKYLGFEVG